jgi:hypothetical protein
VDATPIYTELRNTLMDPEDNDWGPSDPPEFAAALAEKLEHAKTTKAAKSKKTGSRSRARRQRTSKQ